VNKKNIIVVGGSQGIGKSICEELKFKYNVINMSRKKNEEVDNIYCDVTISSSVKKAFEQLNDIPYGIIYCSGFVKVESIYEITEEMLLKTYQVNILGAFRCVQEYVKMNKQEGKIVLIASTSGIRASPAWSSYSSSKSALINMGLSLSEELKSDNKKVYIVSPGRTATELRRKLCPTENQNLIMKPEIIGKFIFKLIDEDDGYLSNQNIIIKKQ
jgi:NAD(P)-dependent dehydrogenase (short-subunit alcohol dehydrogenase family)